MKILHILDHSLPLYSGYSFRSQNIFQSQNRIGIQTIVLTSSKHEASFEYDEVPVYELINGIKYYRSGKLRYNIPIIKEIGLIKRLINRIVDICKVEKPDIIHAHSPVLNGLAALRASRILDIPFVYEIRAFWEDAAVDHGTCREWGIRYRMIRILETYICRKADAIIAICNGIKEDLLSRKRIPTNKIVIIGNAINLSDFDFNINADELRNQFHINDNYLTVGFIGSFYHYEGLLFLLECFAKILEEFPFVKLILVGGGPEEKKLRLKVNELAIEEDVIFTGRIPNKKISSIYSIVDILVLPRLSMRLTEIVTPLKPLEAMIMKKAILASDVGGHKELITHGQTGILFKAGDADDFLKKFFLLANSSNLRSKLGEQGYEYVRKEKNWNLNAKKYNKLYKKILGRIQ